MQEVIDLTFSSPSLPATAGSRTQPRSSSVNVRRLPTNLPSSIISSSPRLLSDEFDASLFVYDETDQQPAKKRKLTPELESAQNDQASSVKSQAEDSLFLFSDDLIPPLPSASRTDAKSTTAKTYSWDGEESDPIVFTSSAPEPAPRKARQELQSHAQRTTVPKITIDDDDIQEFSDPFSLPEDVLSCILEPSQKSTQGRLSDRTAALLANLENRTASRAQGTGSGLRSERKKDEPDLNALLSDEPSEQPQNKPRPKRQPKLSAAEKEAKAREREAAKAQREREKEAEKERKRLQKEEKAKEKQLAADIAEVNKLKVDKKESTPEMIVDLATTFADTSVGNQVTEFMRNLGVERTFFTSSIRNIVKWRRKVKATFNEEAGHWEPCPLHIRLEDHVLCLLSAQEFVNMVIAPPSQAAAEDPDDAETLELHVLKVKSAYPGCKLIYLIEGLTAWMRKNQNSRNRAYQAEVLRQLNDTDSLGDPSNASSRNGGSQARARKKKAQKPEDIPPVDEDAIEDALLQLQVTYTCLIHHTAAAAESAEWIKNFTEHISTIPYRRERMDLNDSAFCMEGGQVKPGEDRADTFVKMLQEVNRVTAPIAYGIAVHYPSATDLLREMKKHGPGMLEDVRKSANKNGALTDSRIGPAVSRRLYKVFMGLDPSSTDI